MPRTTVEEAKRIREIVLKEFAERNRNYEEPLEILRDFSRRFSKQVQYFRNMVKVIPTRFVFCHFEGCDFRGEIPYRELKKFKYCTNHRGYQTAYKIQQQRIKEGRHKKEKKEKGKGERERKVEPVMTPVSISFKQAGRYKFY